MTHTDTTSGRGLRIAFVDDEPEIYPIRYGGKARAIASLARALAERPEVHEVVVCSRSIRPAGAAISVDGVHYRHVDGYGLAAELARLTDDYDVVSVHTCSHTFPHLPQTSARLVYHLHDTIFASINHGSHLDKALGGTWSGVVAPSAFAARTLANVGWWSPISRRVAVVARGIDLAAFSPLPRPVARKRIAKRRPDIAEAIAASYPVLLFPHRPTAEKGGYLLEPLLRQLQVVWPNPLVIATGGAGESGEGVLETGWLATEDMALFYSASDASLVLSHLPESFSQVAVESVLCGCAVVCTRFGNLGELADSVPGLVAAEPHAASVTEAVAAALTLSPLELEEGRSIVSDAYDVRWRAADFLEQCLAFPASGTSSADWSRDREPRVYTSPAAGLYPGCAFIGSAPAERVDLDRLEEEVLAFCASSRRKAEILDRFSAVDGTAIEGSLERLERERLLIGGRNLN